MRKTYSPSGMSTKPLVIGILAIVLSSLFDKKSEKATKHKPNFLSSFSEFNLFVSYPINTGKEFESENKHIGCNLLIKLFGYYYIQH